MSALEIDPREESTEQDLSTRPGPRLREAREKAKLSLEDVSAALRLDLHMVKALESDDYARLPTATFVRGYLRGYARLLNLPDVPILEAYDRHGFESPLLVADITTRPQVKSGDMPVRIVTYAVIIVMLLLMVLWWQTQGEDGSILPGFSFGTDSLPESEAAESGRLAEFEAVPDLPAPAAVEAMAAERLPVESPAISVAPIAGSSAVGDTEVQAEQPTQITAVIETETGSVETETGLTGVEMTAEPQAILEPELVTEPEPAVAPESVPSGRGEVVIEVNRDSWTEVYDADKKRLYFGTASKGKTISVEGKPPIKLLIGYAPGVRIEYNGEFFDHAPYTSKGIARFSLGE